MESELDKWVQNVEPYNMSANDENNEELSEIQMYRVLWLKIILLQIKLLYLKQVKKLKLLK